MEFGWTLAQFPAYPSLLLLILDLELFEMLRRKEAELVSDGSPRENQVVVEGGKKDVRRGREIGESSYYVFTTAPAGFSKLRLI